MNTISRGDAFEQRVYRAIEHELKSERLGLLPHACSLFSKKPYYSRDRASDIIVDISIEVRIPNHLAWSLLWVGECKDYSKPVPVDDVEEFHAKIQQIAGDNVKGVLIVAGPLQESAQRYAAARGIAVIRLFPDNRVTWILAERGSRYEFIDEHEQYRQALIQDSPVSKENLFYAYDGEEFHTSWFSFLAKTLR